MTTRAFEPLHLLDSQLARWQEALEALRCTVSEDRPSANDVALADCYDDAVCDALGVVQEARAEARRLIWPGDVHSAVRSLHRVHVCVNELSRQYGAALAGWERITGLAELGFRRGRAWSQWATALRRALEALPDTIFTTQQALAECWQALADQPRVLDTSTIPLNQN